jgi:hypothetical protein
MRQANSVVERASGRVCESPEPLIPLAPLQRRVGRNRGRAMGIAFAARPLRSPTCPHLGSLLSSPDSSAATLILAALCLPPAASPLWLGSLTSLCCLHSPPSVYAAFRSCTTRLGGGPTPHSHSQTRTICPRWHCSHCRTSIPLTSAIRASHACRSRFGSASTTCSNSRHRCSFSVSFRQKSVG